MNDLFIGIDSQRIDEAVQLLQNVKGGAPVALMKALNTAASGIKDIASKEASKTFAIREKSVKSRKRLSKATVSNLDVTVTRKGGRFFARNFPHRANTNPRVRGGKAVFSRPRQDGSGFYINAEGGRSKAFLAPMRGTSKKGIFVRTSNSGLPMQQVPSLSVPDMLNDNAVLATVQQGATSRFNKELGRQVDSLLSKALKGASQ